MLRLDTGGGVLAIFVLTVALIFGGVYLIDCAFNGCP